ncbi:MAG: calcium-binding protein [Amaricoccus sp.]|uniref:calcium-binding protein n=1 Tax=Amaricoccus sp. TaxID=1872485 RepID=UPI003315DDC4
MATFTGTDESELFSAAELSGTVTADPAGAVPGDEGDSYQPGGGDDTVFGGAGADEIGDRFGTGAGADEFHGAAGDDMLLGGDGDDSLDGDADGDMLLGGDGDDSLDGGSGDDYLDGGDGYDVMLGGRGRDVISIATSSTAVSGDGGRDYVDGGPGADTLRFWEPGTVDLRDGTANISGATWQFLSIENVDAWEDSTVYGDGRANVISVGDGSIAWGFGGDDGLSTFGGKLRGGAGDDRLTGGSVAEQLFGDGGRDRIYGGGGEDLLFGGADNDKLFGDVGNAGEFDSGGDVLFGGAGDDLLAGNGKSDELYGGAGRDRFVFHDVRDSSTVRPDKILGGAPEGGSSAGSVAEAFEGAGRGRGDLIDLRGIDARESSVFSDQAFRFDERTEGGLWLRDDGDVTVVRGNVDDDKGAEFLLRIEDGAATSAADYTAADFLL